jgi:FAD-NAD(P)-binding protein
MSEEVTAVQPLRLAIVGAGPSCTYVLERLAATVSHNGTDVPIAIHVFDKSGEFGAGQVHSTRQPVTSYLNRIVGQVAFGADESVQGAGALLSASMRPTLHEWCRMRFDETGDPVFDLEPEDWPKRYLHGLALKDCFNRYVGMLREHPKVEVNLHHAEVVDLVDRGEHLEVLAADDAGPRVQADHVLLLTGHSSNDPGHSQRLRRWAQFADRTGANYVPSAYPLEDNLTPEVIGTDDVVGCVGMGLTAIDIVLYLTEGRGGRFNERPDGRLEYEPSGREPRSIVAFSTAGLFTFARPFNAKEQDPERLEHRGVFLTYEAVDRLRETAGVPMEIGQIGVQRQLDFEHHIFPIVLLEMAYVYYRTLLGEDFARHLRAQVDDVYRTFLNEAGGHGHGHGHGDASPTAAALIGAVEASVEGVAETLDDVLDGHLAYAELAELDRRWKPERALHRHLEVVLGADAAVEAMRQLAAGEPAGRVLAGAESPWRHPLHVRENRFSWTRAIRPIDEADQVTPERYRAALLDFFDVDHRCAAQGNVDNPAKAAADGVWRDLRPVLAYAVDFGGLNAASHRAFLDTYMRHHNRLANGAALEVMERIRALVEQKFVDVRVGPGAEVHLDESHGKFRIFGPHTQAEVLVDRLVDAKVHPFDPEADVMQIYPNLLRRGLIRKWRNPAQAGADFEPGGLDLTPDFHPIRADGRPDARLTFLGPPSEGVMFFQLGALRPDQNHHVMQDVLCWLREFWQRVLDGGQSAPVEHALTRRYEQDHGDVTVSCPVGAFADPR